MTCPDILDKNKWLVSKLLRMAADEFGNHGCNDVDEDLADHYTDAEKIALAYQYHEWNGDPEECDGTVHDFKMIGDSSWMAYFADLLKYEATHKGE